jgi:hypothetical protein
MGFDSVKVIRLAFIPIFPCSCSCSMFQIPMIEQIRHFFGFFQQSLILQCTTKHSNTLFMTKMNFKTPNTFNYSTKFSRHRKSNIHFISMVTAIPRVVRLYLIGLHGFFKRLFSKTRYFHFK